MAPNKNANMKKETGKKVKKVAVFDGKEETEKTMKADGGVEAKKSASSAGVKKAKSGAGAKKVGKKVVKATKTGKKAATVKSSKVAGKAKKTGVKAAEKVAEPEVKEKENFLAGEAKVTTRKRTKNVPGKTSEERVAELNAEIQRDKYREMAKKSKGVAMDVKVVKDDLNGVGLDELNEAFSGESIEERVRAREMGRAEVLSDESLGIDEVLSGNIDED